MLVLYNECFLHVIVCFSSYINSLWLYYAHMIEVLNTLCSVVTVTMILIQELLYPWFVIKVGT